MSGPDRCPVCDRRWRHFGPRNRVECDDEHVFIRKGGEPLVRVMYPEFTGEQIRETEVELYRRHELHSVPKGVAA
jgi:hypothetical protein